MGPMPGALKHLLARVVELVQHAGLWWGIAISLGLAVGSLAVAAAVIVSWAPDEFKEAHRPKMFARHPPPLRILGMFAKNLAGMVMFVLGFIMALPGIPGQGILTMIIAVTLIDFPGKHELERRLIGRPFVLRKLNAVRHRFHRPPLEVHLEPRHHRRAH
jgi:H+/Cl- antiporter ClcA